MRIFISVDMEGIGGVVSYQQVDAAHPLYHEARQLMEQELRACLEALIEAGIKTAVINDSHDTMLNISCADIGSGKMQLFLIRGRHKPLGMMQGASGCQGAIFLGYHARAGTRHAVLDHSFSSYIYRLSLNGREAGEVGLNATLLSAFRVPLLLVTGDAAACREAEEWMPGVITVPVKKGLSRTAAICLPPGQVKKLIKEKTRESLRRRQEEESRRAFFPFSPGNRWDLEVEFITSEIADVAAFLPFVRRREGRTVVLRDTNYVALYRKFIALLRFVGGYNWLLL